MMKENIFHRRCYDICKSSLSTAPSPKKRSGRNGQNTGNFTTSRKLHHFCKSSFKDQTENIMGKGLLTVLLS